MLHRKFALPDDEPNALPLRDTGPIGFDEAFRRVAAMAKPVGTEKVALWDADDRVLVAPAIAQRSAPLVAVSAMDGYAVRDADLGASPIRLKIVGRSFAGAGFCGTINSGECVRIFTGAPLPAGADRVVVQEDVVLDGSVALFALPPSNRRHVRAAGADFNYGDILVPAGRKLKPQHLVAAAAADLDELEVFRRPRVHILCCGDELARPGEAWRSADKIPESISVGVAALVRRWGGVVNGYDLLPDDVLLLESAARKALQSSELVVVIGGASVGEKDFAKTAFACLGMRQVFSKVAIKPGKPVWLGEVRGTPVLGLPGNPTSALVTARLFLAPLIFGMAGNDPAKALNWRATPFEGAFERCRDRDIFFRAEVGEGCATALKSQDSADQKGLADADVLVRVRPNKQGIAPKGTTVETVEF